MNFLANLIAEYFKKEKKRKKKGALSLELGCSSWNHCFSTYLARRYYMCCLNYLLHSIFICKMRIIIILTSHVVM